MEEDSIIRSAAVERGHGKIGDTTGNLEDNPAVPGYDGPMWVALHAYQNRNWHEVIAMWEQLNRLLPAAAEAVPDGTRSRTCTIAGSQPLTLQLVLEDYIRHMRDHLRHMRVEVGDLA